MQCHVENSSANGATYPINQLTGRVTPTPGQVAACMMHSENKHAWSGALMDLIQSASEAREPSMDTTQ